VLSAILQAIYQFQDGRLENKIFSLSASNQRFIIEHWSRLQNVQTQFSQILANFNCNKWIIQNSSYA